MCQVVIPIGNPPNKSTCQVCGAKTASWDKRWIVLCPKHWQEYLRKD